MPLHPYGHINNEKVCITSLVGCTTSWCVSFCSLVVQVKPLLVLLALKPETF